MMVSLHSTKQTGLTPLYLLASFTLVCTIPPTPPVMAQIVPDNSLGREGSVVVPNQNIRGINSDRIDGGAVRGGNLFHSFQEFNVDVGRGAYFSNPDSIVNILTRVTGDNISNILGTLGVLGNANLFLINPNGIVFGPNARLDVGGSFFASTADGILFENGVEFAASNPEAPPLLTINIPLGLNIRENPGNIVNQSSFPILAADGSIAGFNSLRVPPERTLGLVAGEVRVEGTPLELSDGQIFPLSSNLIAEGGRVELGAVERGVVSLTSVDEGYTLGYEAVQNFGDIQLSLGGIDVSGEGGGDVHLQARRIALTDSSLIRANTLGSQTGGEVSLNASESIEFTEGSFVAANVRSEAIERGGNITINTEQFIIRDGGQITASTFGDGDGGNVTVTATDIELIGTSADGITPSGLFTIVRSQAEQAEGNGGILTINAENLRVQNGALVDASTSGNGNAGNLNINTNQIELIGLSADGRVSSALRSVANPGATGNAGNITVNTQQLTILNGASISTGTSNIGRGGTIEVNATEAIRLNGTGVLVDAVGNQRIVPSIISTQTQELIGEQAGNLTIQTGNLILENGGQITTSTFGSGDAGNLTVRANQIDLVGESANSVFPSALQSNVEELVSNGQLQEGVGASGNAGEVLVEAQRLTLRDGGGISASTRGSGNAGNLTIRVPEILVTGESSGFGTQVNRGGTGNAGNLTVESERLTVQDGGQITASTFGDGDGGNLTVNATDIELIGSSDSGEVVSGLLASVASEAEGNGGTLTINAENLRVRDGAQVDASSFTFSSGNAGNLNINANQIELIGRSADGRTQSALRSVTNLGSTGNAGNITVNTQQLTISDGANIFTGTSGIGRGGTIEVNATDGIRLNGTGVFVDAVGNQRIVPSSISTQTQELIGGQAGNLTIQTGNLTLENGGQVEASTFGGGDAGSLTVRANQIDLVGESADGRFPSGIQSSVQELTSNGQLQEGVGASGNAGEVLVEAQRLTLRDGGGISASTRGSGNAGDLTIRAADIRLMGESFVDGSSSSISSQANVGSTGNGGNVTLEAQQLTLQGGANVSASTFDEGRGGTVTITTENLRLEDGSSVEANTIATGRGGQLNVRAYDLIELKGVSAEGTPSNLSTSSFGILAGEEDAGNAGDVIVTTERLVVQDGAFIGASSGVRGTVTFNQTIVLGGGQPAAAGNIQVIAPFVLLDNQASLTAETTAGDRGNITLNTSDLRLRRNSNITTNATGQATGGNITINTETLTALEDSDISANAEDAFGGQVTINADALFGTQFRPQQTNASDITATSELGPDFSGTVEINNEIDPARGLVDLSTTVVDPAALIAQDPCKLRGDSEFIITGRGGIASSPNDIFIGDRPQVSLVEPVEPVRSTQNHSTSTQRPRTEPNQPRTSADIIPARGWIRDENGDVILVSYDPTKTGVRRQPVQFPQCQP